MLRFACAYSAFHAAGVYSPGTFTLIGSGEMTEAMAKVHRLILGRIEGPVRAVFLDTPAGFELNADEISQRAVAYFAKHFSIPLSVDNVRLNKCAIRRSASTTRIATDYTEGGSAVPCIRVVLTAIRI